MRCARRMGWRTLAVCITLVGCDALAPQETISRFEWAELDQPAAESSQFTILGLDVLLLGDVNTPTACSRLSPEFSESVSTATIRIRAVQTNRTGCGERAATYRYEAFLRELDGISELRVIHAVDGEEPREYVHDLTATT